MDFSAIRGDNPGNGHRRLEVKIKSPTWAQVVLLPICTRSLGIAAVEHPHQLNHPFTRHDHRMVRRQRFQRHRTGRQAVTIGGRAQFAASVSNSMPFK